MPGPWRLRIDRGSPPPVDLPLEDLWVVVRDPLASVDVELLFDEPTCAGADDQATLDGDRSALDSERMVRIVVGAETDAMGERAERDERSTIRLSRDTPLNVLLVVCRLAVEKQAAERSVRKLTDRLAIAESEAQHDVTTGLLNRRGWLRWWERACGEGGPASAWAVALLDLDDFKRINDSRGLAIGDAVLRDVASQLARHVGPADVVARWGGDEFVVALAGADELEAAAKLEALRESVSEVESGSDGRRVTASLGWAGPAPIDLSAPDDWLAERLDLAERGLRAAKGAGRDRGEQSR